MDARKLGRQAALLYLKKAAATTTTPTTTGGPTLKPPPSETAANSVAKPSTTFGATAPTLSPAPAVPKVAPQPAATQAAAGTAPAAGGGGIGGMLGGMFGDPRTAKGLGGLLANPMLKSVVSPMMQIGGLPLLAAGSNYALHGGQDIGNITQGPIGGGAVKPGVT